MANLTDIFIATNDVTSLVSLFSTANGYETEANLSFSKRGFGLRFSTSDDLAMIDFESDEYNLLGYYYGKGNDISYIGVCLKKCYTMLRSVPAKSVGQVYKMSDDDDLYVNSEGSSSKDGASKIPTINLPIDTTAPPLIGPDDEYIKVNTSDFANMCTSISKVDCKTIRFTIKGLALIVQGFNDKSECMCAYSYRNSGPNDEEEEEEIPLEDTGPSKVKKGKLTIVIHRKTPDDQNSVETTIDKLKPLSKINNLCKNGIVYVYVYKRIVEGKCKKIIAIRTNVNQLGPFTVYLKDSSNYNNKNSRNGNHGYF